MSSEKLTTLMRKKPGGVLEKPSTRVPDSAECHALMEGLMYGLFAFSDLSFQQISSKLTIHHYLCGLKECFSTLKLG